MDKWKRYGSYEVWKSSNISTLEYAYKERMDKDYDPIQPDTYVSFDDFCMGQWQWLN